MRRYVILYRRGTGNWGFLTPSLHAGLYNKPEVNAAIDFLRSNPAAEGVAMRLGTDAFNIMVTLEPKTENAFDF